MDSSYQIDINAAKSTKLFKKFMQNKVSTNKSTTNRQQNSNLQKSIPTIQTQIISSENNANYSTHYKQPPQKYIQTQIQSNNISCDQSYHQEQPVKQTRRTTLNDESTDYRKKYDKLYQKYEEIRKTTLQENKNKNKQLEDWNQELQITRQKLFEAQSRQDSLIMQNKRMKQKLQTEGLIRIKLQQDNKQYEYKLQELQDIVQGRDTAIRRKQQQITYWKNQVQTLKQQLSCQKMDNEKLKDQKNIVDAECSIIRRQIANKDSLLSDIRMKIPALVEENNLAKDQLYNLATKLYRLEQENQVLKADLRRKDQHNQSQIHEKLQSINNFSYGVSESMPNRSEVLPNRNEVLPERRRGQFARQRATMRHHVPVDNHRGMEQPISMNKSADIIKSGRTDSMNRIQKIGQQLQKIYDMKAITGAIRRRKIQLQRQLQQLER